MGARNLERAIELIDSILKQVPTQKQMPTPFQHEVGYSVTNGNLPIIVNKYDNGIVVAQTMAMRVATLRRDGTHIDWKAITRKQQALADRLKMCGIEYPDTCNIRTERQDSKLIVHEIAWRCCMEGFRYHLTSLLKETQASPAPPKKKTGRPARKRLTKQQLQAIHRRTEKEDLSVIFESYPDFKYHTAYRQYKQWLKENH